MAKTQLVSHETSAELEMVAVGRALHWLRWMDKQHGGIDQASTDISTAVSGISLCILTHPMYCGLYLTLGPHLLSLLGS